MTDPELEQQLRSWFQAEIPAAETAPPSLRSTVAAIPWVTRLAPRPVDSRGLRLLAVAAALATTIAGALLIGSGIDEKPSVVAPSDAPSPTPSTAPQPSGTPAEVVRIVYTRERRLNLGEEDCQSTTGSPYCHRASVFVSNADGSNEEELVPGPNSYVLDVAPDGSTILVTVQDSSPFSRPYVTDLAGSEPELLDTGCRLPCTDDWGFALSPDGSRIAFARNLGEMATGYHVGSVITIMDLATGEVRELDSTLASNPDLGDPCHANCGGGDNYGPTWSPDGAHLLFPRGGIGIPDQPRMFLDSALFIVDVDGANLRQLTPLEVHATDAHWSPDGERIAFTSSLDTLAPGTDNWQQLNDIYTIRTDGTGMVRLTTDTVSPLGFDDPGEFGARFPKWTLDGHIVFTRNAAPGEDLIQVWVMAGDGSAVSQIEPTDATTLTNLGCLACPYPGTVPDNVWPTTGYWMRLP